MIDFTKDVYTFADLDGIPAEELPDWETDQVLWQPEELEKMLEHNSPSPGWLEEMLNGGNLTRFVTGSTIVQASTKVDYHIKDRLEASTTGSIVGPPAGGKTAVVLDLIGGILSGQDWNGHQCERGGAVVFLGEGFGGFGRRLEAMKHHRGIEEEDLEALIVTRSIESFTAQNLIQLLPEIRSYFARLKVTPRLIVIDTLARHLDGDENSTKDMNNFINLVDRVRDSLGTASALILHHTGHQDTGRGRGASSRLGAMDFEWRVGGGQISCLKSKDSAPFDPIPFVLQPVNIGEDPETGETITSVVPVYGERPNWLKTPKLTPIEQEVFDALQPGSSLEEWRECFKSNSTKRQPKSANTTFNRSVPPLIEKGVVLLKNDTYRPATGDKLATDGDTSPVGTATDGDTPL